MAANETNDLDNLGGVAGGLTLGIDASRAREAYTGQIARALGKLKRFCGVQSIRQNYKGTGTQAARRQLYVHLKDGRAIDVWLDHDSYKLGGVTVLRVPGTYEYNDLTPAQVANAIAQLLQRIEPA